VNHKKEKQGLGYTNAEFTSPDSLSVFRLTNSILILPNNIVQLSPPTQCALLIYRTVPYLVPTDEFSCDVTVTSVMQ